MKTLAAMVVLAAAAWLLSGTAPTGESAIHVPPGFEVVIEGAGPS